MDSKGISPLIATVILIAIVIAIAAIASQFLTSFAQARQSEISTQGEEVVDCGFANFEIDPDAVNHSTGTNVLLITIENTGRTDLVIKDIVYSNTTAKIREVAVATKRSDSGTLNVSYPFKVGTIVTIQNNTVGYRPDRITVTTACPGVTASIENDTSTNKFKQVFD